MLRIVVKENVAIFATPNENHKIEIPNTHIIQVGDAEELRLYIVEHNIDITQIVSDVIPYLAELNLTEADLAPYITRETLE